MTRRSTALVLGSLLLLGVWLWDHARARASIPTCTDELAAAYPPMLRGDLSACRAPSDPKPQADIDLKKFATTLNGTWTLQSRTLQGISVEGKGRIHFELDDAAAAGAVGSAVALDCLDAECTRTRVAGAWSVGLAPVADSHIALTTTGRSLTPDAKTASVANESTQSKFFLQSGVYVAIDESGDKLAHERKWDRMVITDKTLSYVSCRDGRVERYRKSSSASLVDGTPVREFLKRTIVGQLLSR